MFNSY